MILVSSLCMCRTLQKIIVSSISVLNITKKNRFKHICIEHFKKVVQAYWHCMYSILIFFVKYLILLIANSSIVLILEHFVTIQVYTATGNQSKCVISARGR